MLRHEATISLAPREEVGEGHLEKMVLSGGRHSALFPHPSVEACGIVFQTMSRSDCHRPRALFTRVHVAVCVAGTFSCTYSIESFQTGFPMCCSSSFIPLSPELKMQRSIFFLPPTNCRGLYYCLVELVLYTRLLKTSPSSLVDGCQDGRNKGGFQ